jgi:hypothetical protein
VPKIEDALFTKLSGTTAISDIVGTRIHPVKMPDNPTFPSITYQRISSTREQTMQGRVSYCEAIMQIDIWSQDYDVTRDLASKVFSALEGFRGPISSVDIQAILSQNEIDLFEDDVKVYRRSQTFRVIFIEI